MREREKKERGKEREKSAVLYRGQIGNGAVFKNNPKLQNLDASGTKVHGKRQRRSESKKKRNASLKKYNQRVLILLLL